MARDATVTIEIGDLPAIKAAFAAGLFVIDQLKDLIDDLASPTPCDVVDVNGLGDERLYMCATHATVGELPCPHARARALLDQRHRQED